MARYYDRDGERTIGVLTKIDLMDEGTNVNRILDGRIYPLKHGYVPIVCRSQKDTENGVKLDDHFAKEDEFFKTHPDYQNRALKCGTSYLTRNCNDIIVRHIK